MAGTMKVEETAASLLERTRALLPAVAAGSSEAERLRTLPRELVDELAKAGLFRMLVPRRLGGLEVDPAAAMRAIEAVSSADGSAGWCVMIGASTGVNGGLLAPKAAEEIYGSDPMVVTGGVFAPRGRAVRTAGGFVVSGRWPFASGCRHCSWLLGGCTIVDEAGNAEPVPRLLYFPAGEVQIIDTWNVSGLRGTGSHDIAVENVFVPERRAVGLGFDRAKQPGPLYVFPVFGLLACCVAAVALGIARSAVETLVGLAGGKVPTGARRPLAERSVVQADVARAEYLLTSARSALYEAVADAWQTVCAGGRASTRQRAALRLAAAGAARASADAVDLMYDAGGASSIYDDNLLQRHFRDVHVVTQHIMVAPSTFELTGRILLGLETDTSLL
jgi:alkylation response protein AidB-like acyl-CoA dehydrogenase